MWDYKVIRENVVISGEIVHWISIPRELRIYLKISQHGATWGVLGNYFRDVSIHFRYLPANFVLSPRFLRLFDRIQLSVCISWVYGIYECTCTYVGRCIERIDPSNAEKVLLRKKIRTLRHTLMQHVRTHFSRVLMCEMTYFYR